MHEMALVRSIVDVVLERAEASHVTEVKAVNIVIGEGRDVIEELMSGLFDYLARGTVAQNAVLNIKRVPITARCDECGCVFPLDFRREETWSCPNCGARQKYKLQTGMEFYISTIDVTNGIVPDSDEQKQARMKAAEAQERWVRTSRESVARQASSGSTCAGKAESTQTPAQERSPHQTLQSAAPAAH